MGPVLSSGDLPGLFIPFWIFRSKDVHCAVIAGHADEGRVLIEVNAAERPGGIGFHGRKGSPAPARSPPAGWRLRPQPPVLQAAVLRTAPPLTSPRESKPGQGPACNSRALLGCTDAHGWMPRTGRGFLQPPGACHSGEKSPCLQSACPLEAGIPWVGGTPTGVPGAHHSAPEAWPLHL